MNITKTVEGEKLTVALEGRLDTLTAPELEESLSSALEGIKELVLDLSGLEYLSSAGLRVVLSTFKTVSAAEGKMTICNANEMVSKVFELTGFGNIIAIE
ncbi:MAG: STAS domain-containing protein [Firmicutes bacterium]|nr:STAS domain-containing protein [Bacillota bacterium]